MSNIIYLRPFENNTAFTTYCFYNLFLKELQDHYANTKEPPIFSIEKLTRIDPIVLPNLLGLGFYLSKYHKSPIELRLSYNPKLLYYLFKADFFKYGGKPDDINPTGLNIFKFDDRFIGGFYNYIEKEQREEHRLHYYLPLSPSNRSMDSHDLLVEDLTLFTLREHFEKVLLDIIPLSSIDSAIESIAEPISNGILHSGSITWAISQTTPAPFTKTVLSIVDVGIGFKESLKLNKIEKYIIPAIIKKGKLKDYLEDFYYIFESLCFSILKNRSGLIDFILKIAEKGTIRIHYNSTQILFTPRILESIPGLKECRKDVLREFHENNSISKATQERAIKEIIFLSELHLKLYSSNKKYSPVRIYDVIFKGVHIEFELPKNQ
jgi:hypothetical protein